jgi:signal transduction histidine kinase
MRLRPFARSSIARVAVLHGLLLAASMMAVLGVVYLWTSRILASEGDELVSVEAQSISADFREKDLDTFVSEIIDRAEDPWIRGGVYEMRGPRGDFLAGNVVVLPELNPDKAGWAEFDVDVMHGEASVPRHVRGRVLKLENGFRVLVGHDVQDRLAFRGIMLRSLAWAVVMVVLFGSLGGWWLGRRISRTAQAITESAGRIARGDLGERLPISGSGDEIDALVMRFNDLLGRVDTLTGTMRAVLDSTAHDLRGHLNRIRAAAQDAYHAAVEPAQRESMATVLAEIDRLSETLQGLLRIALAESGTAPLELVDLSQLTSDLLEFYAPVAADGQLSADIEAGIRVHGHRQLLAQALSNLLDNAVKYGGTAPIHVRLTRMGESALLEVEDGGIGIPEDQRELATQRFRRLRGSSGMPGSGLGLSLVAAVARLHQSKLQLDDAQPGLRVSFQLPLDG